MNEDRIRGVNLGGWLVLERWMTPSVFEGTDAQDEYGFMQTPGAQEKITRHRDKFIQEADFKWLAEHGVNAVRIPVGYWIFDGDVPFTECIAYLDWAMEMAEKHGLKVLIDLHAAKGSQNGNDHSGRVGRLDWFIEQEYRQQTTRVVRQIAERYRDAPALWGIELLNEPGFGARKFFISKRFYNEAYQAVVKVAKKGTHIVFSDAFHPRLLSGAVKPMEDFPVIMDVHWYQFGRTDLPAYFRRLAGRSYEIERLEQRQPVIIGEWSGMLSHLTIGHLPEAEQNALQKQHIERQRDVYSGAAGWFYWTYKTEAPGIWNFRDLVEQGVFTLEPSGGTLEK